MCGIAGIVGENARLREEALRRMVAAQIHRGPDADGVFASQKGSCVLGHRRLSIIDLSAAAAQPMHCLDTNCTLVYNGECYNFDVLRKQLPNAQRLESAGDTRVVAEWLQHRGAEGLGALNGMFALALWNEKDASLLLARDRFGQKPLYYTRTPEGLFLFASEIRALLASGLVEREADPEALESYLAYGAVQGPRTILRGVSLLPAGCFLWLRKGEVKLERYWNFPREKRSQPAGELRETFRGAVERHLVSDAPIGLFLSGGTDSSAVAAAAARARGEAVISLSVVFPDSAEHSEQRFAQLMAKHAGTDHREVPITGSEMAALLHECLAAMDQPTVDSMNTYMVAYAARKAGLKVALSGLGGDELFGGYPIFADLPRLLRMSGLLGLMRRPAARLLRGAASANRKLEKMADMLESPEELLDLYLARRRIFSARQLREMLAAPVLQGSAFLLSEEYERLRAAAGGRAIEDAIGVLEMQTYMEQMLLRDSDVMGMANSLEIRLPMLDTEFAEAALMMPPQVRRPGTPAKAAFVEALGGWLPREITHRPKQGFTFPFAHWMLKELRGEVAQRLEMQPARLAPVNGAFVRGLWERFQSAPDAVGWTRPWTIFVLLDFLQRHKLRIPECT